MGVLWYWKNVSNKNSSCAEAGQVVIDRLFLEGAGPSLHHQDRRHKLSMTSAHVCLCFISAMENVSISKELWEESMFYGAERTEFRVCNSFCVLIDMNCWYD